MDFERELELTLPPDLPNRSHLIAIAARHLRLVVEANERMNLTRITECREAVIKHILDSVTPWRFFASATTVLDAGTGAGFPGIPLAAVLPQVNFVLADSTAKKARFVETAVASLGLRNVEVAAERAEDILRTSRFDLIAARAVAPVERALAYFGPGLRNGTRAILYKGPDVASEIKDAEGEAQRHRVKLEVVMRYNLPDSLGARTVVRVSGP